jgi:diguanylate cyclase (GGDEF)-like protein/PAS domain S-box-containing protein
VLPLPTQSDARIAAALALLPDAALAVDEGGIVLAVNDGVERMFGYAGAEVVGWPLALLLPDAASLEALLAARGDDATGVKLEGRRATGVPFAVEACARRVETADGVQQVCTLRGLAPDVLAGEAQRYFDAAFDDAPIGMALFNSDGEYVRVNRALCEILERSAEELLGRRDQEFTHPDDRQADVDAAWEILDGRRSTHQCEKRFVRPDGTVVWTLANLTFLRDDAGRSLSWVGQFQDITARRDVEQALRRERDVSAAILASMQEGFALTRDGEIINVNDALCRLTGFSREQLVGARVPLPFWPADAHDELMAVRKRLIEQGGGEIETTLVRRDGTRFEASWTCTRAAGPDGADVGFVQTIRDISERKRHEQDLERRATRDSLTGLLNRAAFRRRLAEEASRAERTGAPMSLALLDLDHFKRINDAHGHPAGDRALAEVAARLRAVSRPDDDLARLGGEEFAWLLPGSEGEDAFKAAERAREAIAEMALDGLGKLTVSIGVCELAAGADVEDLYRIADAALYRAKAHGRNRCRLGDGA